MGYHRHFSHFALGTALLAGLSGCTWLIPDDPSSLRYNSVLGERHAPVGNVASANPAPLPEEETGQAIVTETMTTPVVPMVQSRPPMVVAAVPTPEVIASPIMQPAPAPMPMTQPTPQPMPIMQPAPYPMPVMQPEPAPSAMMQGLPPVDALTQARAHTEFARQTPTENALLDVAQNNFTSVPPRPVTVGADAPAARLDNVRRDLEAERARAATSREQLLRDVQAEPSMLPGNGRPQDPAIIHAPVNDKGAVLSPEAASSPTGYVSLPPPPPLGMPAPPMGAPERIASAPMPAPEPVMMQAAAPMPPMPGGFDPLAVHAALSTPPVAYAATGGYLQPSRYKR